MDQATVNQFMQNIVIGGQTRDGKDATNRCTYLFLDTCASVGLPTPTVNPRLHKNSREELLQKGELEETKVGIVISEKVKENPLLKGLFLAAEFFPDFYFEKAEEEVIEATNKTTDFNTGLMNTLMNINSKLTPQEKEQMSKAAQRFFKST